MKLGVIVMFDMGILCEGIRKCTGESVEQWVYLEKWVLISTGWIILSAAWSILRNKCRLFWWQGHSE